MTRALAVALALFVSLFGAASCEQPPVPEGAAFFAGKTITYIVATRAGGGYDTYARLITKHMARRIPDVRIIVLNVPGAANILGANQIYDAPPDGLTMGTFTMGLMYSQLTAAPGVRFDLTKMSWIGKAASEPRTLAVGEKSGFRSVEDLRRSPEPVRLGTGPVGSPTYYQAKMLGEATGFRVEVVPGFEEDEAVLAALRGDFAGGLSSPSSVAPMVKQGQMRILMSVGTGPELPPSVVDARTVTISPLGHSLMAFGAIQSELGRVTAAAPGVPADRLEVLRQAYMSAVTDPALQAELRQIGFPVDPMDGLTVTTKVAQALRPASDVAAWLHAVSAR